MLDRAEQILDGVDLSGSVKIVHSPIQNLDRWISDTFDIITCHAVLEWLADPRETLGHLTKFVRRDSRLSLMFYNSNAALLKHVLRGQFSTALREHKEGFTPRGWGDGATPLAEEVVREWLSELGFRVRSKAGIRVFHDHLPPSTQGRKLVDDLLEVETELRKQEPFASLGQHIHLMCDMA